MMLKQENLESHTYLAETVQHQQAGLQPHFRLPRTIWFAANA